MLARYRDGVVPAAGGDPLDRAGRDAVAAYQRAMDALDLRAGAEAAWALVATANLGIQQSAPWTLAKEGKDAELDQVLAGLARTLYRLAVLIAPFMPDKAQALWSALGSEGEVHGSSWSALADPPVVGRRTEKAEILFPKPAKA
jgi:methionyl-tRNA synthetase